MESESRIEKLLALILLNNVSGNTDRQKATLLNIAGFTNVEIANLLETSSSVIRQYLYEEGRKASKTKKAKKSK